MKKSEKEMNKLAIIAALIILIISFSSNFCLAQQHSASEIQVLKKNPKIIMPDTVFEDFMKGKPSIRVIVNLKDPLTQGPTYDRDSSTRDRSPTFSRRAHRLKDLSVRRRLQTDVDAMQNGVITDLDMDTMRITNRFKYIFGFSTEITFQELQNLAKHPDVLSVEEDMLLHANLAQGIPLMNASTISGIYNGAGMAIAICDTGIDYNHPMLGGGGFPNDKVIGGYDTGEDDADPIDGEGHGTACAGIAAGSLGDTGDYIGGVAFNAKLYALKISYSSTIGGAYLSDMVEAWEWCVTHQNDDPMNPIMIISTSFGGGRYTDICDDVSSAMTAAAANARAVGMTIFVSSGNDGYCDATGWPGCLSDVIRVGAVYDAALGEIGWCVSEDSCAPKLPTSGCSTGFYSLETGTPDSVIVYSNTSSFLSLFAPANWAYTTKLGGGY
jgi:subtilisin family serine protease